MQMSVSNRWKAWENLELASICKPFILVIKARWVWEWLEGIVFSNYEQFEGRCIRNLVEGKLQV